MATRRLNKKVALIGSGIVMLVLLAGIAVVFQLGRDPQEALKEAETALQAAREATNEQEKEQHYVRAEHAFRIAYGGARDDRQRKELLFKMIDMYLETGEWDNVVRFWEAIIKLDPKNVKARYGRLTFVYIIADNGGHGAWQQVHDWASEFLEDADNDVLAQDTANYDVPQLSQKTDGAQRLDAYLYGIRGRAALELVRLGMVTDKDESLAKAIADLKKLQELDPNNVLSRLYLARAAVIKGEIFAAKGNFQERNKASQEAIGYLEEAVALSNSDPRALIELLTLKLKLARDSGFSELRERMQSLESDYLALVKQFDSHAKAHASLSAFYAEYSTYAGPELRSDYLKKAIAAAEEAMALDEESVAYALQAARLHYRRFSIYDEKAGIDKAVEIAKNALTLPGAQETTGPWQRVHGLNRYGLYALLADCYLERIFKNRASAESSQVQEWLVEAEQAVHEIEQILGSVEEPLVIKWRGMLELARGNTDEAVRNLYRAYEQFRSVMPPQPPWPRDLEFAQLSYTLAEIFKDTTETGAVLDFLLRAIYSGISEVKPEAYLDYVDALLELNHWSDALQHIESFEEYFGANRRSQVLRVRSYIGARQFIEAEEELTAMPVDDVDTIKLRLMLTQERIRYVQRAANQTKRNDTSGAASVPESLQDLSDDLRNYRTYEAELLDQWLTIDPNTVSEASFISVCRNYIEQGQTDLAERLVDRFSKIFPDSATVQVYKQILSEPDPANVSGQRIKEIEEQALSNAADPLLRSLKLGIFHRRYNELEEATAQFQKAFEIARSRETVPEGPAFERFKLTANHYLDMAIDKADWDLAEDIVQVARTKDLDGCQGQVFATRLALAKGDFKDALVRANDCLTQKPIFSHGYMLRSHIHAALENDHAAMDDIRMAAVLNPLDGTIARGLASALYHRNQKLGNNISDVQVAETRDALLRAVGLNPGDLELRSLYADYIASIEPLKAVAIRQDLVQADPSLDNMLLLGKLATEVAVGQENPQNKQAMFDIAGSAFAQAKQTAPNDKRVLYYYAEYFRAKGQEEQAKVLLQQSDDQTLLWDHYLQAGKYKEAQKVLRQLYESGTRHAGVLRGLLLIADKIADKEGVKQYSEELIEAEDTLANNFAQLQAFLRVGLIKEAENKLQRFKEKYPNEPRSLWLQAWLVMRQGKMNEALDLANRNLQADTENPAAWRLRGDIHFFRGDFNKAISDLQKSKMLSDESLTRISLARTYERMERYDDAITELRNVINKAEAPIEARLLLEHIYLQLNRTTELGRFYEETLEKYPEDVHWLNRAGAYALRTGEITRAEAYYTKALQLRRQLHSDQDKKEAMKDELCAASFEGYLKSLIAAAGIPETADWHPEKLNKVFEVGLEHVEGPLGHIAYLQMARAKLVLGERRTAVEYCRRALDLAGADEVLASDILMRTYTMLGIKEVEDYCRQKLREDPESLAANLIMFYLTSRNREYNNAINYIKKCIEHLDATDPRRVEFILKKGEVLTDAYEETSDKQYLNAAIADYESLLDKMPKNSHVATVLNNLAYLLAKTGERLPDALQYAKRALDMKPNSPGILDTYAYVLLKNGNVPEADRFLSAALQHFAQDRLPVSAEVLEHKGMIKERLGKKQEALAAYEEALDVGEKSLSEKAKLRIQKAVARISP